MVFKSFADMPVDQKLRHAMSPPCSEHTVELKKGVEEPSSSNTQTKLKRRWSLLPFRRNRSSNPNRRSLSVAVSDSEDALPSVPRKNGSSLPPRKDRVSVSRQDPVQSKDSPKPQAPQEQQQVILLMTPEERLKVLAEQFGNSASVDIDVSGRSFNRMTKNRRSLIHVSFEFEKILSDLMFFLQADFHIARHRISLPERSRSKSPIKQRSPHALMTNHGSRASTSVSPYAYGNVRPFAMPVLPKTPLIERGCQTDAPPAPPSTSAKVEPSKNVSVRQQRVQVEVHNQNTRRKMYDDTTTDDYQFGDDEDDDKDYVVVVNARKQNSQKAVHSSSSSLAAQPRHVDPLLISTSSATSASTYYQLSSTNTVKSMEKVVKNPNGSLNHPGVANMRTKDKSSAGGGGGRSSSGNWSAATSDLHQSSSASSSPLHQVSAVQSDRPAKAVNYRSLSLNRNYGGASKAAASSIKAESSDAGAGSGKDEVESVYSVDNDGYYTSMHTDSGLYGFGTFPMVHGQGVNNGVSSFSTATTNNNISRLHSIKNMRRKLTEKKKRFERIQEEEKQSSGGSLTFTGDSLQKWKGPNFGARMQAQDSTLKKQQSKSVQRNTNFGSNESVNSILSNSDVPSTQPSGTPANGDVETDFDCSVSFCSHQPGQHKHKIVAPSKVLDNKLRTVSGTFEEDNSVSEFHDQPGNSFKFSNQRPRSMHRSLTESSSASSSCRKLMPPPPPPPRVSSMLRTLQKYADDAQQQQRKQHKEQQKTLNQKSSDEEEELVGDDEDVFSTVSDSVRTQCSEDNDHSLMSVNSESLVSGTGDEPNSETTDTLVTNRSSNTTSTAQKYLLARRNSSRATERSDTNSEYFRNQNERHKRLFLSGPVDSARSYPPLSYIGPYYDGTTADSASTTISLASSAAYAFDDDEYRLDCPDSSSALFDKTSNRTLTPTNCANGDEDRDDDSPDSDGLNVKLASERNKSIDSSSVNGESEKLHQQQESSRKQPSPPSSLESASNNSPRHLSSPLPPPKLSSLTRLNKQRAKEQQDWKQTERGQRSLSSQPTPAPRNSLSSPPTSNGSTFNTSYTGNSSTRDAFFADKSNEISSNDPEKKETSVSPQQPRSPMSPEQIRIVLHNSAKKHNIRAEPELFVNKTRSPASLSTSPSHQSTSPKFDPHKMSGQLKRRSWTGDPHADSERINGNGTLNGSSTNQPRTRQSLALDRLGPIRPTTLNDFKRLLSQVRSPLSPPAVNGPNTMPTLSTTAKANSVYSALQEVLANGHKSLPSHGVRAIAKVDGSLVKDNNNNTSTFSTTSSGISSPLSPLPSSLSSPLSPTATNSSSLTSPSSSPEHKSSSSSSNISSPSVTSTTVPSVNGSAQSMDNFIKKFSKSKFLSKSGASAGGVDRSKSAVARLDVVGGLCPTILEDEDVNAGDQQNNNNKPTTQDSDEKLNSVASAAAKLNISCTSTWV